MDNGDLMVGLANYWHVDCYDPDGNLVWTDDAKNLIPREGGGKLFTDTFKSTGYTSAWYVGLINAAATFATTDTYSSHPGWTELINYASVTRPLATFGIVNTSANVVSMSVSIPEMIMTGSGTAAGLFIASSSAKGDSTPGPIIYGEVAFSGGDKAYLVDYAIIPTITLTVTVS